MVRNPTRTLEIEESYSKPGDYEFSVLFDSRYYSVRKYPVSQGMVPSWNQEAYYYVGPPSSRESVKKGVIAAWTSTASPHPADRAGPILLEAKAGSLQLEKLMELLKQQDKRPILLPE